MLREIHEQPAAIERTLQHYVEGNKFRESSFGSSADCFRRHKDIIITASGSSRHAGLAAEIMLEDAAGLSVDVEYASEYICRTTNTKRDPAVLVISQSGETGDTLAALREAILRGHPTLAVTNVQNSSMMQEASIALPTLAGVELAIPATKSFTTQLVVLRLLSLYAALAQKPLADLPGSVLSLRRQRLLKLGMSYPSLRQHQQAKRNSVPMRRHICGCSSLS